MSLIRAVTALLRGSHTLNKAVTALVTSRAASTVTRLKDTPFLGFYPPKVGFLLVYVHLPPSLSKLAIFASILLDDPLATAVHISLCRSPLEMHM